MRTLRVAAVVAAVGLGSLAVGCGQAPGTDKAATGPGGKPTEKGGGTPAKPNTPADKAMAAADEVNKRLEPVKQGLDKLKAKIAADEKEMKDDIDKVLAVGKLRKLRDEAEAGMKQVADKVAAFKDAKDDAALDAAKKAAGEAVGTLEGLLKDYTGK